MKTLTLQGVNITISECATVVVVPEISLTEPGYIKTCSDNESGNAKHEFHALAQIAYFQFQDEELEIVEVDSPLTISDGTESIEITDGMVLCRDRAGELHVLAYARQNRKKLLEAAYRYCTRWVRLDI